MTEEQIINALLTGGPALVVVGALLWFALPLRAPLVALLKQKAGLLILLAPLLLAGCVSFDPISHRNAVEMRDTIEKYLDPALPESARKAALDQADASVEYEESKR